MSRTRVSARSDANEPIASMLVHMSRSLSGWRRICRAIGHSGVASTDAINHKVVALDASTFGSMSGSRRHAT